MLVTRTIQTNSGSRETRRPGARMSRMVAVRLIAPMIVPAPFTASPRM